MNASLRALFFFIAFILGMGTMRVYDTSTGAVAPELDRVTIMRPVPHDAVPKPVEKLNAVGASDDEDGQQTEVTTSTTSQTTSTSTGPAPQTPQTPPPHTTPPTSQPSTTPPGTPESGVVDFVYDGDTVRLADKRKIRLIGIDTPEMNYGKGDPECYAREAKKQLEALVNKKQISFVADAEDKDRYGRLLRYIYVDTPEGPVFVNNAIVLQGGGIAKRYPPNTSQAVTLETSMAEAQTAKRGLWGACR